jgi:hypothetical protein
MGCSVKCRRGSHVRHTATLQGRVWSPWPWSGHGAAATAAVWTVRAKEGLGRQLGMHARARVLVSRDRGMAVPCAGYRRSGARWRRRLRQARAARRAPARERDRKGGGREGVPRATYWRAHRRRRAHRQHEGIGTRAAALTGRARRRGSRCGGGSLQAR